jgi:hypothetical protein
MIRSSASLVVLGGSLVKGSGISLLLWSSKFFVPILWRSTGIRTDAMYQLQVIVLIVAVVSSCVFVRFCHFLLQLEHAKRLNLIFAEFCELIIEL